MDEPSLEVRAATAVYSPPRPPADRRLVDVRRIDQTYEPPVFDSLEAWERRKAELRRQILCAAGVWPEPPRTPLLPQVGQPAAFDGYTVQTVALQSRPGFYVTGNLYRPLDAPGRRPGLLNPHGHSKRGRLEHTDNSSTPARCITFARQGYVAFAYDMVGYNDARQIPHHFGNARDWLWGLGALGLQLWNSIRALDFLLSLPDVDPARIGCVGESGGGTQTFLLAAVDERVGYPAPVVMVSAHFQGGCVCENAPGLRLDTNNVEIAAMAAPRPMTLVSATGDWTRNTPTVEFPAIRRIYALYGAADRLSETQITAPHNFNQATREAVYRFFAHAFSGTPLDAPQPEQPLAPPPEEVLRIFPADLPADALDSAGVRRAARQFAREQLVATAPRDAATLARFRDGLGLAYRLAIDTQPARPEDIVIVSERLGETRFGPHNAGRLLVGRLARGERIPALFFRGAEAGGPPPVVLTHAAGKAAFFTERDGETVPGGLLTTILDSGRAALLFDSFLTGDYQTPYALSGRDQSSPHFLTFNRSDAALRVQDVVTAVAAARHLTGTGTVDLVGLDEAGLWCLLARPLAEGVDRLLASGANLAIGDEADYLRRLYIPGLLRCGGLETALLLAAPGETRLFNLAGGPIERPAALYAALGRPQSLTAQAGPVTDDQLLAWLSAER